LTKYYSYLVHLNLLCHCSYFVLDLCWYC